MTRAFRTVVISPKSGRATRPGDVAQDDCPDHPAPMLASLVAGVAGWSTCGSDARGRLGQPVVRRARRLGPATRVR